ncbi:hypothetical protein [Vibrio parahaemolyticus]|uniref:hypothetical protein n=1 Tax=Vibrio parahaemolyticus TaxID=670 RepID=UPI003D81626A
MTLFTSKMTIEELSTEQLEQLADSDMSNALTILASHPEIDIERIRLLCQLGEMKASELVIRDEHLAIANSLTWTERLMQDDINWLVSEATIKGRALKVWQSVGGYYQAVLVSLDNYHRQLELGRIQDRQSAQLAAARIALKIIDGVEA